MLISYNWLKELVDFDYSAEDLAHRLSMQGIEAKVNGIIDDDAIIETEPTTNRPDCLSMVGIAREIQAMCASNMRYPDIDMEIAVGKKCPISINVKDPDLCPRYVGVYLENIDIKESPRWMTDRLSRMGVRSINNVVDATNYVLLELGHPTHAFDADLIEGSEIVVRKAGKTASMKTLDDIKRDLTAQTLLIWDSKKPVALAGVMGAGNSEINPKTKSVFIESAYFDPGSIRSTSKRLGLSTESSYRFERGADPQCALTASRRLLYILKDTAGAHVRGEIVDSFVCPVPQNKILLRGDRLNRILGVRLDAKRVEDILNSLEFEVRKCDSEKNSFEVVSPSFRAEVYREIDLIEEIARIYGYNNIKASSPRARSRPVTKNRQERIITRAKQYLAGSGANEIITYSFVSSTDLSATEEAVKIPNPLSSEQSVMRTTLMPGMLRTAANNINKSVKDMMLFEVGKVYLPKKNIASTHESMKIALVSSGDYLSLKGVVEGLISCLGIEDAVFQKSEHSWLEAEISSSIDIGGKEIGFCGNVSRDVLQKYDISIPLIVSEVDLEVMGKLAKIDKRFMNIMKFPAVERDMALILDENVSYGDCEMCIRLSGGPLLRDVTLFDIYRGKPLAAGKKSLGFALVYQDDARTLTEEDVDVYHKQILDACFRKFGAELRSG